MSIVIPFQFNTESEIRTVLINDEVWFVASDIARVLDFRDAEKLTRMLDDDEADTHIVGTRSENGIEQKREVTIINESGLYHALIKSRKPEAKPFRKWVTGVVLPSIRKTGKYEHQPVQIVTINQAQYQQLAAAIRESLVGWCFNAGDREKIGNHIRILFNLKSLRDLPADKFHEALHIASQAKLLGNEAFEVMDALKRELVDSVIAGGEPHTNAIARKYKNKFGELPKQINWIEMVKTLNNVSGQIGG